MTLPLVDHTRLQGVEGPEYRVGPYCARPGCGRIADHAHHLVRRSRLGGPFAWVQIGEETYQNLTGLCVNCHDLVTGAVGGHRAAIRLTDGVFLWCDVRHTERGPLYVPVDAIVPQPSTLETFANPRTPGPPASEAACPTCGHVAKRRRTSGAVRRRKTWGMLVPDDGEDGAEVLDTLCDLLGETLNIEPNRSGRYHIVVYALTYAELDKTRFKRTLAGVGG